MSRPHGLLDCVGFWDVADGVVAYLWNECSDGREYAAGCEGSGGDWFCACSVNDVETTRFTLEPDEDPWDRTVAHRSFNNHCGWLVPRL